MKLQLIAVGSKMVDWIQTGFQDYLHRFPKDMAFELIEIPVGKILISNVSSRKEGEQSWQG